MKRTFQKRTDGQEIENQFQEKFAECMSQLRNGFTELIERRKEYRLAKQSKKSQSKNTWKTVKEGHKLRIKECKTKISNARNEFNLLVQSINLSSDAKAVAV